MSASTRLIASGRKVRSYYGGKAARQRGGRMVSFSTAMPIDDLAPRLPPDRPFSGVAFDAAVNKSRNGQTMDNGEVIIRNWLARHKKSS